MTAAEVKCRREYRFAIKVPGQPETYETVYVIRKRDLGSPGVWVEYRDEDGRRGLTHPCHLRPLEDAKK